MDERTAGRAVANALRPSTPAERFGKPVIGTVVTKETPLLDEHGTVVETLPRKTYEVVAVAQIAPGGATGYVTNVWYKEHRSEPLVILAEFVEAFHPKGR